ncbi:helix-turn-helix transcriptional regulator [uncultured Psychroserpens sp.]|uniref:helix-turn-helix transcriptional regulator n=1 Tax=uncultured Psychroserpens sp. TaxID=255436 RepID=UPI00261D6A88|nr:helix-turn-helix transcriptional regulator [uncultured Psychroserpens sp.]
MISHAHTISPSLSKYVAAMIYNKDYYPECEMDKYLPDGTINIIFELTGTDKFIFDNNTKKKKQGYSDVWFSGVLKDYITISAASEEMIVVVFKPGSGFPLIHKSVNLYTNKVVQANEIFGTSILELHTQLKAPTSPQEKFNAIEKWLLPQFKEDDFYTNIIHFAIDTIQNSSSKISIANLAKKTGFSQKQFIQLFKKYVGITPKQFHRIIRFNEILAALENKEKISWTAISADCGYFDQAHFIKDFQSFSGLNPKKYLSDVGDYPNYVPVK